ncbi:phosphatidylinositol 3-kinase tor2 [Xylona heveae TC161]|uniref:Serine/threonine-protein kinase TOR n=1 Tax=Xylona heveae (strain CBS 132557 / TC161) TaxID=1328760 RepID=A0A165H2C4_XYLHT|nr:phosphatidylinositol 3-kinase tor2 [Xylona heveae TC161]KZF22892.1 phosphatidylinositol 3-kinase tor2 [Xylona heveae TC161]
MAQPDTLNRIFQELKSKNDEVRQKAAYELLDQLSTASRELTPEKFQEYYNLVNGRVAQLVVHSNDTNERIGGILALDRLIDFDGDDAAQKTTRFSSYLRSVMRSNDTAAMVVAARALGRLATPGGTLTAELVESEVKAALEWLQSDRQENRRFAAVLSLRELAKNSPTLLYAFVPQIFDVIWVALRDPKVLIRESAAEAASACFEIISARDAQLRQQWFSRIYEEALQGLRLPSTEAIHGSLLTIKELFLRGGMFMHDHYRDACEIILRYKDHREPLVRRQIVVLIPILAAYAPMDFVTNYLHKVMVYLQGQLKREKDRNAAFIAIGKIASAVGSAIAPYLDGILVYVREGLSMKTRNRNVNEAPVFECISMLSIAVGQTLSKYMEALLEPIFACGLSESLTQALVDMAHYIPPIKPMIQEKLLDVLSQVLCGRPFKPLGSPSGGLPPPSIGVRDHKDPLAVEQRETEIALALHTLGSFDFSGHVLNEFVRDVAIRYVEDDNPEIRKAAALTCCQLFVRDPIVYQTSHHAIQVVSEVIEKLLTVGVADADSDIRRTVLLSLDARFDRHLAKAENVRTLFLALNDEVFGIREAAITIIGRLTSVNPAYVFPSLRKVLIQILTELEYSNVPRNKEESAKLLSLFVANSTALIKPYVDPMITVLLPKAKDPNAGVAATVLKAIGELATVGGEDMLPYVPDLMPTIIEALQDLSSPPKREAALRTLGQLASNSGYVIDPYLEHPQLLSILVNIVKTEQTGTLRKETIKLMGILGALDPYKHQQVIEKSPESHLAAETQPVTDVSLIMNGLTPSNDEYYPTVVINTLMGVLKDTSLSQYHSAVIDAIMNIFKTLGLKCVPFLGQIIPGFVGVIRSSAPGRLESCFNQLSILVSIVRQHIRPYLKEILDVAQEFWGATAQLQATILSLVEAISRSLEGEFKVYLADLLPLMLGVLEKDSTPRRLPSERVLHTFLVFGASSEEYLHLIIPVIVRTFEKPQQPTSIRRQAIETLAKLSRQVNISDFASRIIHPLSRILAGGDIILRQAALDTLCALIFQLGQDYLHFVPMIQKILAINKLTHTNYDLLVSKLQKGEPLPQDLSPDERYNEPTEDSPFADIGQRKLPVNQQHLKNAWEASQKSTREDWQEWMRRFSVELLKESPSHALRACAGLAGVYYPLAKDLFNAAFVSCWTELYDQYQEELVRSIEIALTSPHIPPEILQILLNLAEFMEHDEKALPIDIRMLGMYAYKCHAFAKALHYKELEFLQDQNSSAVEALISINNHLQQSDAAIGILRKAQNYRDVDLKETWFEKLQRWEEALQAYQRRELEEPDSFEVTFGKMRCLHALGEWDVLSSLAQEKWVQSSTEHRREIASLAAAAAWGLGQWELMDNYLAAMKSHSPDRSFFGAILSLHRNQFDDAALHIERAREGLDTELSALLGESYNRAYTVVVRVQMLAELEEIITYKQNSNNPEKQATMRRTWIKRLKGCQRNVEVWQRMLNVRALVISPKENLEMWIKFSNLCRKSNRIGLAEKSLDSLLDISDETSSISSAIQAPPQVKYAQLKYKWATGAQEEALTSLKTFTARMTDDLVTARASIPTTNGINGNGMMPLTNGINGTAVSTIKDLDEYSKLLARCYLKQGEWQAALNRGDWQHRFVHEILASFSAATQHNKDWYKAWHAWALANFEVVTSLTRAQPEVVVVPQNIVIDHVVPAVRGFFKSIALSSGSSLQDTLRLLTLWFAHGGHHEVNLAVVEGIASVSVDTWLDVIPQLIARINQPNARVRQSIHNLLAEVGRVHPQALVYPLTVSMKSNLARRSRAAAQIMETLRPHSANLVEQADVVSQELIRVAVLWHELWHEGLEEASRLYFGDHNIEGMLATLAPLHALIDKGPETLREISFCQLFGRDLQEARDWCQTYRRTGEVGDINQAWDLYYQVFRKIAKQLHQIWSLDLQYVSPKLLNVRDLDLVVPGTYQSGKPVIRIVSFDPTFTVLNSKQRPRKMSLKGSDGNSYTYVLKGHEDLRQDERCMQLFGLVNTLLATDSECFKRHLNIQRYPAIPLSQNSGLLGWVPNSDTLHVLIREYRESRKILINIEQRIMLQMAPDYDNLTLMQKVEVFGYALDNTTGQDLYRVLWLKSKNSESWLDRRTNFTRSLAVMSMVGYILGLGDRHPSNLMLDRVTGKVIHIDFGDCFEVAMYREKYPERVPFRLTRMLTYAMEVSNVEGSYRITCEAVMRVLRDNQESLMAVLEAFIHDPLLNWRLGNRESPPEPSFPSERRQSLVGDLEQRPESRPRARPALIDAEPAGHEAREVQNARALQVLSRVKEKLTGSDFTPGRELKVPEQVDKLIQQATNLENLCQHWYGWCSYW